MDTIFGSTVREFGEDKMSWKSDRNKGFMVNDYYSLLVGSNDFWVAFFKLKIPSRVAFFVWATALRKCLTIGNLQKRKVSFGYWIGVICASVMWIDWPSLPSLSNCYGFVVYGFGFIWSKLGYITVSYRAPSLLARQAWLSSKWSYIVSCSPFNVVSLEGKK